MLRNKKMLPESMKIKRATIQMQMHRMIQSKILPAQEKTQNNRNRSKMKLVHRRKELKYLKILPAQRNKINNNRMKMRNLMKNLI